MIKKKVVKIKALCFTKVAKYLMEMSVIVQQIQLKNHNRGNLG